MFIKSYTVIGYIFEGEVHCDSCTGKRFPHYQGTDREGNEISVYTVDDASNSDTDTCCGDCSELLWEVES